MEICQGFEQGPIRPPSEADSLLIRLTRNCPWNRCTFCSVYKSERFSLRPLEDVLREIDTIHRCINEIRETAESPLSGICLSRVRNAGDRQAFLAARSWLGAGMTSVFLQDADSLTMKPKNLIAVLNHLKMRFPMVERITSYARSSTLARISDVDLREMALAGLNRIHIGLETGSDRILEMVRKGVDKKTQIEGGLKARRAGMEVSEYVLTGLGGLDYWQEHAVETADALNRINPDFIRFRTLRISDTVKLFDREERAWSRSTDLIQAREVRLLIESLTDVSSRIKSDHVFNLFQEIDGVLPRDKERLLAVLGEFIEMDPKRRTLFQVGKRMGYFRRLSELRMAGLSAQVEEICRRLDISPENVDEKINEMIREGMKAGMRF